MSRSNTKAIVKLAEETWDRLAQENPDHEVDKESIIAEIERVIVVDIDQLRHEAAARAVEAVDRKRTTPRNGWSDQLRLPVIPDDEYLVVGNGKRVQRTWAKIDHVFTTLRITWENVQKVTTSAQSMQSYYSELMEDLAKGKAEGEALRAYQVRNGIGLDESDTAA